MTACALVGGDFRALKKRIRVLRGKFLSRQLCDERKNPLTFVPDLERLAAFRLMAHAEIEDYLEQKAKNVVDRIKNDISNGRKVVECLEWFALADIFDTEIPIKCPHDITAFNAAADKILSQGLSFISNNNGIKQKSFLVLSLLIGKRVCELDDALSASLQAFGNERGNVAHKSVKRVANINAPSAEDATVNSLLENLRIYFYGI